MFQSSEIRISSVVFHVFQLKTSPYSIVRQDTFSFILFLYIPVTNLFQSFFDSNSSLLPACLLCLNLLVCNLGSIDVSGWTTMKLICYTNAISLWHWEMYKFNIYHRSLFQRCYCYLSLLAPIINYQERFVFSNPHRISRTFQNNKRTGNSCYNRYLQQL